MIKRARGFYETFDRKDGSQTTTFCAGCGHGIVHKLIGEAMADLGLQDRAVFVSPVGCAAFCYYYFDCGNVAAPHGRASAVATGLSRVLKDKVVIAYQGDGDLGAIGFNNAFQAANRGERFACFFINNSLFAMTGGQMAPTTLVGQKTTTSPYGRNSDHCGFPVRVAEMLSTLEGAAYVERVSLHDVPNVNKAKKAIRKAFETQMAGKGFSLVELLSTCPTNWGLSPVEALEWLKTNMIPYYPLGVYKEVK